MECNCLRVHAEWFPTFKTSIRFIISNRNYTDNLWYLEYDNGDKRIFGPIKRPFSTIPFSRSSDWTKAKGLVFVILNASVYSQKRKQSRLLRNGTVLISSQHCLANKKNSEKVCQLTQSSFLNQSSTSASRTNFSLINGNKIRHSPIIQMRKRLKTSTVLLHHDSLKHGLQDPDIWESSKSHFFQTEIPRFYLDLIDDIEMQCSLPDKKCELW